MEHHTKWYTVGMGNPVRWLWNKVGGNLLWDAIARISKWVWGVGMTSTVLALTLGWLQSLPWVLLYLYALYAFLVALTVANEWQRRQIQKKVEQGELIPPLLLHTNEELQSTVKTLQKKLTTIERRRPHLTAEIIPLRQKIPSGHTSLSNEVSFIFLRIRNEPPNHNIRAIAHNLHAKIWYCDEQWNPLCPSAQGLWRLTEGVTINYIQELKPRDTAYLYLAMKTYWEESCYSLDATNAQSKEWQHSQHKLANRTIYVKVVLTCHLYQAPYHYMLTNEKGKKDLGCKEIPLEARPVAS